MSIQIDNIQEILERKVKKDGNSAKVSIPKKHLGKTVTVIIQEEEVEE